jgi:hypothetical protein
LLNGLRKDSVKDNCYNISVIPDVDQLVSGVAIVGIDWSEARFESGEQTFEILRAVVHVLRNFVLLLNASVEKGLGDSVSSSIEIGPGVRLIFVLLGESVWKPFGDRLPGIGEVPGCCCGYLMGHEGSS